MDLDVFVLCIGVPTQTWKFLIYTHWFYPPQGEQRQSFSPLFWLASVGFIFHCLHPSITFQFSFQPNRLLDLWHGGSFSPLELLLDKPPCLYCLGSELVTKLAFGKLDCMPKSFWSVVSMFGTVQNSHWSLEMLLAKTESSCTTCIEIFNMRPWKMKIVKLCFLTYVKRERAMKC